MSIQSSFFSADHDDDPYASSHAGEQALNRAIVTAEISQSFEEYLEIFDAFYADDVEVSSDTETILGKAKIRSLLFNFLVPLHVMAEVGGLSISIRDTAIPGGTASETHSAWDTRLDRGIRCNLHITLVHPSEMERVARRVRTSL